MQRHRLLGNLRGVPEQVQLFNQFIAAGLILPSKRVGIRTSLNLISVEGRGHEASARLRLHLTDFRAFAGKEKLVNLAEIHRRLGQRHPLHLAQLRIDFQQQVEAGRVKGSTLQAASQWSTTLPSGANRTSRFLQSALARAISTARPAAASMDGRERSCVEANPQAPSTITRMPMPSECESRT